jgi:hypothetical protein
MACRTEMMRAQCCENIELSTLHLSLFPNTLSYHILASLKTLARLVTTLKTMPESVPLSSTPALPPAKDIPSTFMASLRSWSAQNGPCLAQSF